MRSNPNAKLDEFVGGRIAVVRHGLGVSQQQLAAQVGITEAALSAIEKGTLRADAHKLYRFAECLRQPLGYFYGTAEAVLSSGLSEAEVVFLSRFRALREDQREAVGALLAAMMS